MHHKLLVHTNTNPSHILHVVILLLPSTIGRRFASFMAAQFLAIPPLFHIITTAITLISIALSCYGCCRMLSTATDLRRLTLARKGAVAPISVCVKEESCPSRHRDDRRPNHGVCTGGVFMESHHWCTTLATIPKYEWWFEAHCLKPLER